MVEEDMLEQKQSILVVDDNPSNVHELSSALITDYEVICATSGAKAIQLAVEFLPDIILLDVMMPPPDGYEVLTRLKSTPKTQNIPVIFITARDDTESETKGLDIGAVDFITKPVNLAIVRSRVRNHLAQRRIEMSLRDTARRLAEAEELAHVAAWEWNISADTFYFSDEWLRIHGCYNRPTSFEDMMALVHPEDREQMSAMFLDTSAGLNRCDFQYRIIRRNDGAVRIVQARRYIQQTPEGADRLMSGASQDITEQKLVEFELARMKDVAEKANAAKSAFLATMSHELRTPLTSVIGFSEIIRDQLFGLIGNKIYVEYAHDIWNSGNHLLSLINDVLDVAKIESGRMSIEKEALSPEALVLSVLRLVREHASKHRLVLATNVAVDGGVLWADERAVKQILFNLLSNAVKFTPDGGRITVDMCSDSSGGVSLVVRDTGVGISADCLSRLTRPFEQVDNRYSRANGGTGLGLSLVRGLAELHGGYVAIESELGKGAAVTVYFPPRTARKDA
ncbi:two-component system, cell cycle sensor histidine kinase PleC [Azospirillaceae bacterium]